MPLADALTLPGVFAHKKKAAKGNVVFATDARIKLISPPCFGA
ncbi:hypothetical protein SynBIOSE41_04169 [Synechococcus sp. BIOS-E4-1]|nr:hypothetical protein SynBIOSE41_04169 [Synechococcus sp. BIOS-E4-1]